MGGDDFAQTGRRSAASLDRRFHSAHIAPHMNAHQAGTDFLGADQRHIRRFHHGIRRFDRRNQTTGLNHS